MLKKDKVALITGITGQDGSYLAELLLEKKYEVLYFKRTLSSFNTSRIEQIYQDLYEIYPNERIEEDPNEAQKKYMLKNNGFSIYAS